MEAPVAQLDRALPSEGKGHTFESCRARHFAISPEWRHESVFVHGKVQPCARLMTESQFRIYLK